MNLAELADLIVVQLDGHYPVPHKAGDPPRHYRCLCGMMIELGSLNRHRTDAIIAAIMSEGSGIARNEAYGK